MSNYPPGMTAADHAYIDGRHPPCKHEEWIVDSSDAVEDYHSSKGDIILRIVCVDCNAHGYATYKSELKEVYFDE
mgnify:FL=1|tara:strand:+ start:13091 stop:13315 length:225 start_codon:yes stop_codon:yes gene_type:complete